MASKGGILQFLKQVRAEIRKTTWPTWEQVKKALTAVGVVCIAYAVMTGVADFIIGLIFRYVLGL